MDKIKEYVDAIDVPIALKNLKDDIVDQFNDKSYDSNSENN